MYEQFFGLTEKPFSIQPDPSFLYWGRTHRLAYAMLEYGVLNHAGISVITGEVGCGKTTLIHRLLDQLADTHTVALISNIQEGRGDLLSWVLMGFGEPFAGKSHVELFSQLQDFFISEYGKGRRVVLVIDEAQNLSTDMLEELRMLSNINAGKDQLLQLILVGQPQLKDLLNQPELLQLAQRIGADFHLTPLTCEEVHAYIETRLAIAGCTRRIFTDRAMDFLAEQSRGVPRIINVIADTALVYAFSAEELVVGVDTIRNVIRDKSEFGVFGIASDKNAAAPLKPANPSAMDSFADAADAEKKRAGGGSTPSAPSPHVRDGFDTRPHDVTPSHVEPHPAPRRIVAPSADLDEGDRAPALTAQPATTRLRDDAISAREESSITGIVITGARSPGALEAAIHSAGDGLAIVYAAWPGEVETSEVARNAGAVVAECAEGAEATLGRLRNAGYRQLKKIAPHVQYIQFLDANQELAPAWVRLAQRFMARRPEIVMLEGGVAEINKRGEMRPHREFVDGDAEIIIPHTDSAFVRASAFEDAGGFRGDIPTAEFDDLSIRLRRRGGRVWRVEQTMSGCKARPRSREGWWSRRFRRGYDNAFRASLHGAPPERLGVSSTLAAVAFGAILPLGVLALTGAAAVLSPYLMPADPAYILPSLVFGAGLAAYLIIGLVDAVFFRSPGGAGFGSTLLSAFGRTPECLGACMFWLGSERPR
ncbi:MAG: AAA family ATPase [Pseudomonadota bacterium]